MFERVNAKISCIVYVGKDNEEGEFDDLFIRTNGYVTWNLLLDRSQEDLIINAVTEVWDKIPKDIHVKIELEQQSEQDGMTWNNWFDVSSIEVFKGEE